jgi:hypothetical protein
MAFVLFFYSKAHFPQLMLTKKPKSRRRKLLKVVLLAILVFVLASVGFHIWFVNNARSFIRNMVAEKSHGKLKLELSQISFNFFSNRFQVKEASLVSTDSLTAPASYHVTFRQLTMNTGSFWSLVFHRKLTLDSIALHDPQIVVTQRRNDTSLTIARDEVSISKEMGKLYNSMLDGLDAFGIKRIIISNARLTLINKMKPGAEPISVSNVNFNLIRTAGAIGKRDEYIQDRQSVDLTTTDQNIALPGGRHRLSFRSFNLQLFNKRIELDSCTIRALAKDSMNSSYTVFFEKLLLVGVDFDALYRYNLIKADSVYCENPLFDININTSLASSVKKDKPDPQKIIRELTGDLDLAFVGVKDAGIHVNITGKKKRSLFNSNKDDFEMHGLRINADSSQPVVVQRFDMLVRDYRLYNEDSSAAYTFDSIHFLNNKIVLNNFTVSTTATSQKLRSERDFRIPYFELTGLDWYQLIFEENLVAKEAVMYNPVISYIKKTAGAHKKTDIFKSFRTLDNVITLNKVSVINGQIYMKLGPATSLELQNANLSLYSDRLLQSTDDEGLRRAIGRLSFSNALLHFKNFTAEIQDAAYTGNTLLHAGRISVREKGNRSFALINDVDLDDLFVNEATSTIDLKGLRWKNAKVRIQSPAGPSGNKKGTNLHLENISGNHTDISYSDGKNTMSTFIQSVKIASLVKNAKSGIQVKGLSTAGRDLDVRTRSLKARVNDYALSDDGPSFLSGVEVYQVKGRDSLSLQAPRIDFTADINGLLSRDLHLTNLEARHAVVKINKWDTGSAGTVKDRQPSLRIDHITLSEPDIFFSQHKNDSATTVRLPVSDQSLLKAGALQLNGDGFSLGSLSLHTTSATMVKSTGEVIGVEKGAVDVELSDLHFSKKDGKPSWAAIINTLHLKNPNSFTIGKNRNKLQLDETSIGNLNLSSAYINDFGSLLKFNISAWLHTTTGQYTDSVLTLKWYNANYNSAEKTLGLDSFFYHPTQPLDSVMSRAAFQTDYISLRTGPLQLTGFNLDNYEKDSALVIDTMLIKAPVLTVYRDKKPPFLSGINKPLPVDMIRAIPFPVLVQKLKIVDGLVSYTEKNAKTRAEGTLRLTGMNAALSNIRNRDIGEGDSLLLTMDARLMDSAPIRLMVKESYTDTLSGFLMTLLLKPTTLSFLNPVLMPLSNVKITSGTIDSFYLRAIGKEDLSIGEMKMYYHNLRIKLLKNGEENKSGFIGNVVSFLANTFLIKKNNNGRTGIVYFERLKDRSFFNYIVKTTFSGMATSIGVKKNRKFLKEYRQQLKQQNLPPLEFE